MAQLASLMGEMENDAERCRECARAGKLQLCQAVWSRFSRKYESLLTALPEVESVQCRLRADKTVFEVGEPLTFKVDVRNRGARKLNVYRTADRQELQLDIMLEVDGKSFSPSPRGIDGLPFGPGAEYASITGRLDGPNRHIRAGRSDPFHLGPGKHRIRVVFTGRPTNSAMAPVRTWSNPIEVEVIGP